MIKTVLFRNYLFTKWLNFIVIKYNTFFKKDCNTNEKNSRFSTIFLNAYLERLISTKNSIKNIVLDCNKVNTPLKFHSCWSRDLGFREVFSRRYSTYRKKLVPIALPSIKYS